MSMLTNSIRVGVEGLLVKETIALELPLLLEQMPLKPMISEHSLHALIALVGIKFLSHEAIEKAFNHFASSEKYGIITKILGK